jgi:hypothetical protein
VLAKLVPAHRRKLGRIVAGKLGDAQRGSRAGIPGADEDLDRHTKPLKVWEDRRGAPKRVVKGHADRPEAGQRANLSQQKIRVNTEPVLPGRRNGVVAEDERSHAGGSTRGIKRP